jgi:polygalacturonase
MSTMRLNPVHIVAAGLLASLVVTGQDANRASRPAGDYNVRTFGAKGDGKTLDTAAVNRAIDAAAAAGGGTVWFPAGSYLCFSIHLKSHVALYLDEGSTIIAASPDENGGRYDAPEPNAWSQYQDFGHSHWHNITISNCVFDYSRGLALEAVDGAWLEDVTIDNITMRDVVNAPFFLRLGNRARGPKESTDVGKFRRVNISNVVVYNAEPRYGSIISGIPGHDIEDLKLNNITMFYRGGGTREQAAIEPPEEETKYPEPTMFGDIPAYGFFVRHVRGLEMNNVDVRYLADDLRSPFLLNEVKDAGFVHVKAQHAAGVPVFVLKDVENFSTHQTAGLPDTRMDHVKQGKY